MMNRSTQFRISSRTVLKPGDWFAASGGGHFWTGDAYDADTKTWRRRTINLADPGPFQFMAHVRNGRSEWIEAISRHGFTILRLSGGRRRSKVLDSVVVAPYRGLKPSKPPKSKKKRTRA